MTTRYQASATQEAELPACPRFGCGGDVWFVTDVTSGYDQAACKVCGLLGPKGRGLTAAGDLWREYVGRVRENRERREVVMDIKNLDAIKARSAAATPGPWEWALQPISAQEVLRRVGSKRWDDTVLHAVGCGCEEPEVEIGEPDQEFIAHARADVDDLLAEVERLGANLWRLHVAAVHDEEPMNEWAKEYIERYAIDVARWAMSQER